MKIVIKNKNNNEAFEIDEGAVITLCKDETLDSGTISISNLTHEIDIEPYDVCNLIGKSNYTMCVNSFVKTQICLQPKLYKYDITLFSLVKQLEGIILPNLKITKIKGITRSIWSYMTEYLKEYCPQIKVGTLEDFDYYQKWVLDTTFESKFADECPEMQWNQPTLREVLNDLATLKDCIVILNADNKISFMDLTEVTTPNETALSSINYVQESKSSEDYVSDLRVNLINVTNDKSDEINNYVTRSEWISATSNDALMTSENIIFKTQYPIYKIKKLEMLFPVRIGMINQTDFDEVHFSIWIRQNLMDARLLHFKGSYGANDGTSNIGPLITITSDMEPSEGIDTCNVTEHCNLVYESKEWQVLKNVDSFTAINGIYSDEYPLWKECTLYYTRGSTDIVGFNQKYIKAADYTSTTLLNRLKQILTGGRRNQISKTYNDKVYDYIGISSHNVYNKSAWGEANYTYYATYFYIEYETLEGSIIKAGKDIIKDSNGNYYPSHQREVIDNQTNSYVDSYSQGFLEYQKANRLGNIQKMINARYLNNETSANMLKIGDTIEDSIIYKCEYQFYKQHTEVNALATKDYVLRNYFTGVKAKIRSWNIVSGNEALTRSDIYKYYLEFSYKQKDDNGFAWEDIYNYNLPEYFISSLINNNIEPLRYCFMYTEDKLGNRYPADETIEGVTEHCYYKIDLVSRVIGNSLVFTFGLKDNFWVDKYIDLTNTDINLANGTSTNITYSLNQVPYQQSQIPGGITTQYHKYADNNGEFKYVSWLFTDDYVGKAFNISTGYSTLEGSGSREFIKYACACPKTSESDFRGELTIDDTTHTWDYTKAEFYKELHKDSQEITNISTQFEFCKDTNNICFTKEFINRQKAVRTIANNISLRLVVANSNTYNFRNIQLPSSLEQINTYNIIVSHTNITTASTNISFIIEDQHKNDLLNKALYIVDGNNVVLMALNNVPSDNISESARRTVLHIYLNLLKTRDYDIYDAQTTQNVVDKL